MVDKVYMMTRLSVMSIFGDESFSCIEEEGHMHKGNSCPVFRQVWGVGSRELFLCLLFPSCSQLKILLRPKWHISGLQILTPF